ncbi:MAG: hypothetical protein JWP51_4599 [Bradyrhizobium sp.]|nr:hypothetical protein [Bradyrhizobium sp.]
MTSLPLVTQRLLAHIVRSPRRSIVLWLAVMLGRAELPGRGELAGLRPGTRLLIVGLTAWIGLVGLVTVIAVASIEISAMSFPAWFGSRASASPSTEIRSAAGFENILLRPLFSRRRQIATPATVSAPQPPLPAKLDQNITVKGVFISGALAKAFLTSAQNPLGVWVQVDGEVAGWRVVAVKPDQVLLDGQNEKLVIPLSVSGGTK